jgi:hypothetical protein
MSTLPVLLDRAKCQIDESQMRLIFKQSKCKGFQRSAFEGLDDEAFVEHFPKLMLLLVQATPRLNESTVEKAYFQEYGQGLADKNLPRDLSVAICNGFRFLRCKAKNVKTGNKLSPVIWRMLVAMTDPPPNLIGIIAKAEPKTETQKEDKQEQEPKSPVQACKAAKAHEDQSPGSVLAMYGVGREHVKAVGRRPLRKNISCVSLSSTEEDLAVASKIAYAIDEDMAGQSIPLAEQSSASSSQVELFF